MTKMTIQKLQITAINLRARADNNHDSTIQKLLSSRAIVEASTAIHGSIFQHRY